MRISFFPLLLAAAVPLPAQTAQDATLRELVTEVRQLRLALERSAAVIPRLQVTLQRMLIQQDAARAAMREWDQSRDQVRYSSNHEADLAGQVMRLEADTGRQQDAAKRSMWEQELKQMRFQLERQRTVASDFRARESELAGRQRAEQAKLDEIGNQLQALERELATPPPTRP